MKKRKIAVLGASGAVGREMISILMEEGFGQKDITALGGKSAGSIIDISGERFSVRSAEDFDFSGADVVFGAVSAELARFYAPRIKSAGAVFIDNSSAFRLDPDVPLVVPEINPHDAEAHHGTIANPNCSTIITAVAVGGINRLSPIKSMTVSTYQAVSGAGSEGITELKEQIAASVTGGDTVPRVFPYRIAENVIPCISSPCENLYTDEEMKLQREGRKIFGLPSLCVNCTCVRVPVVRSHSVSVTLYCERPVSVYEARDAISRFDGCVLFDDIREGKYPMPILSSGGDAVLVGRVRETLDGLGGINLFCCGDQLRKGAAKNAVQIMGLLT